jgi:hypothetical protein
MTERLTMVFEAASKQMAACLADMQGRQRMRRQRWNDDVRHTLDQFHLDARRNSGGLSLSYWVSLYFLEGMGDIAAQRLLAVYLPMLQTLQRIELDAAKVPGYSIWPADDVRMYTGSLRRVDE